MDFSIDSGRKGASREGKRFIGRLREGDVRNKEGEGMAPHPIFSGGRVSHQNRSGTFKKGGGVITPNGD